MQKSTLLISGSGIAGSTLAVLAARQGFQVTVVERAAGIRSSGSPVDVHGAAFEVAERLDIVDTLREFATQTRELVFVDDAGAPRASMAINEAVDPRHIEIARTELSAILSNAGRHEYETLWSDHITALRDRGPGAGIEVEFAKSSPRVFDVVVGADGLHSGVRAIAFGAEDEFVKFLGLYVATLQLRERATDLDQVTMHNGPGISLSVHPGTGKPMAAFIFRSEQRVPYRDAEAKLKLLRDRYAGSGWRAAELLNSVATAEDLYFDAVSQVRMRNWSIGAIGLVGDAASSLSLFGDGSSSAILGAATLAAQLATAKDGDLDWVSAFHQYERIHRRVIAPNLRGFALSTRLLVPRTSAGIGLRNTALRTMARLQRSRRQPRSPSS
jgi:2-polyprenyl-6-methoxyphenol hydroxylase-like FAD-dependent oxidoreductase